MYGYNSMFVRTRVSYIVFGFPLDMLRLALFFSAYLQWKETIDKNLHVIWIENKTFRKKWSFYFIKGMPDGIFKWKNRKPEVSIF
jgi:hypothetical protein